MAKGTALFDNVAIAGTGAVRVGRGGAAMRVGPICAGAEWCGSDCGGHALLRRLCAGRRRCGAHARWGRHVQERHDLELEGGACAPVASARSMSHVAQCSRATLHVAHDGAWHVVRACHVV